MLKQQILNLLALLRRGDPPQLGFRSTEKPDLNLNDRVAEVEIRLDELAPERVGPGVGRV